MAKDAYYAVAVGRTVGIFATWDGGAKEEVTGYPGARYKKFKTEAEAQAFIAVHAAGKKRMRDESPLTVPATRRKIEPKFYAVACGLHGVTGIFTSWAEAECHVRNFAGAKFKSFATLAEAQTFLQEHATVIKSVARDASQPNPMDPSTLVAFCDGSAIGNGARSCKAAFACVFPHHEDWSVAGKLPSDAAATNNRAEYLAALEAMKRANLQDPEKVQPLFIFSDSMLLIKSMTEWLAGWKRNHWRKANGEPVKNADLLKRLEDTQGTRRILWRHVKAHTNKKDWESVWNDKADQLAQATARGKSNSLLTP
ncbi:ribonuclease [Achlya hypogyna]|uniref:ribonuclease H n=1 Tax=Achlya hypogyna TaxID=1202772 RepID=A0A1V9YZU6_ACHHY|nr:ribonuclease [Achlya hypogyna]